METGEHPKPKEETTRIPTETANMVGRGLQQMFAEPIKKLEDALNSEILKKVDPQYQSWMQDWKPKLQATTDMWDALATARGEVFVTTKEGGGDFIFKTQGILSRFLSTLRPLNSATITIPGDLAAKIMWVLNDRMNNNITHIAGYAELISTKSTDEEVRKHTKEIQSLIMQFSDTFRNKFVRVPDIEQIQLTRDSQGRITMTPSFLSSSLSQKT